MKKFLSVLMLVLLAVVFTGCSGKRTFVADGTYVGWKLTQTSSDLLLADGSKALDEAGANIKVNTPVLVTVEVVIHNDQIVSFWIDELQSKPSIKGTYNPADGVKSVTWTWNEKTKKELEYDYNMEASAPLGEWFIQATKIENYWLENGVVGEDVEITGASIHYNDYAEAANIALDNAKKGIVSAITEKEHYTYDVTFVTGKIDAKGKITDIKLDAQLFGNTNDNTYVKGHADYLKFSWNPKTKYESYPEMRDGKKWQDQIDTLNAYINEYGWDGTLLSGNSSNATKGINKNGQAVDALSTITVQTYREVLVMNKLLKYFPNAWK